jgi:hypothetical protein
MPAAGKYRFHEEGTRRAGSTGQNQPFAVDGTLTVTHKNADVTLSFSSSQGEDEMRLRHETTRVLLTYVRLKQAVATFEGTFDPPQVVLRWPLRSGDTWTNEWKAGNTSGTTKITITREETIRAFGRDWNTYVIANHTDARGDAQGTTESTSWYAPELGLDIKRVSDFKGTYKGVPFDQRSERTLTSRP